MLNYAADDSQSLCKWFGFFMFCVLLGSLCSFVEGIHPYCSGCRTHKTIGSYMAEIAVKGNGDGAEENGLVALVKKLWNGCR